MKHFNELQNWPWWQKKSNGEQFMIIVALLLAIAFMCEKIKKTDYSRNTNNASIEITNEPVKSAEQQKVDGMQQYGEVYSMQAVRLASKDPQNVEFLQRIFEQVYPGTNMYVAKYTIKATNSYGETVQALASVSIEYKGGAVSDVHNWDLKNVEIN
jgi:hypothetical protein